MPPNGIGLARTSMLLALVRHVHMLVMSYSGLLPKLLLTLVPFPPASGRHRRYVELLLTRAEVTLTTCLCVCLGTRRMKLSRLRPELWKFTLCFTFDLQQEVEWDTPNAITYRHRR